MKGILQYINMQINKSNIFLMVISALEKGKAEEGTRKYQGEEQIYNVKQGCQGSCQSEGRILQNFNKVLGWIRKQAFMCLCSGKIFQAEEKASTKALRREFVQCVQ